MLVHWFNPPIMPKITTETKNQIKNLTRDELEKIVIKFAGRDKFMLGFLKVNYLDKEFGELDLFDEAISDLDALFVKSFKGRSIQLQMAKMLAASAKRIAEFSKVAKQKNREADLIIHVLEVPFSMPRGYFGTSFKAYDTQVGRLLKKLVSLVESKMHEDYRAEYQEKVNTYLSTLHRTSNHINLIYNLPTHI